MKTTQVKSSNLVAVGYDAKKKTLRVEFKANRIYDYTPVTKDIHDALMASESMGQYFFKHIKGNPSINVKRIQ